MNHSDIQSLTAKYLDGELSLDLRARFDGHLDQCDECTLELSEMRATIKLLRTLPNPETPPDLVDNVMARIREGEGQLAWHERLADFLSQLAIPRFALPAAAMAAALAVVMLGGDIQLPASDAGDPAGRAGQLAIAPGTPVSLAAARQQPTAAFPMRVNNSRMAQHRSYNLPAGGTFVFRGETHDLGPLTRDSRSPGFVFDNRLQRMGPVLGASAASGDSQLHLVNVRAGSAVRAGSPQSRGANPGLGTFIISQSGLGEERTGSSHTGGIGRDDHRQLMLDARLAALLEDPTLFARKLSALALAEQELWLRQLASRSLDHGRSDDVVRALRDSGVVTADDLANTFAAAARQIREERGAHVASQRESE